MRWIDVLIQVGRQQWTRLVPVFVAFLVAALLALCFLSTARAQQAQSEPGAAGSHSRPTTQPRLSQPTTSQPPVPPAAHPSSPQLRFLVVLDPAHGGSDNGAMLAPGTPEKNYTLALAVRLHVLLNARGIHSVLTRDADVIVDNTARAVAANRAHASACILLHATPTGNGVHLFTSSLPPVPRADPRRSFLPWQTAQASYGTLSLRLESDINSAFAKAHLPVLLDRTSLMPLDSMACPAVAVEIAPLNATTPLTNSGYQEQIASSLAEALVEWRRDWRLQP